MEDEKTFNLLKKTPLIPNRSGSWSIPSAVYFYEEKLVKLIGNYAHLWIDEEKLLNDKSIKKFMKDLGVSTTPSPQILMERMVKLSENHLPTNDVIEKSSNAFYKLCELYVKDEDSDGTSMREVITECAEELLDGDCFPVLNNNEEWHSSVDEYLYNPSQYKAIEHSDALILAYTSNKKLKGCENLLNSIGIQLEIDFDDVIVHLRRCVEKNESVDNLVYEVLNNQINDIIKSNPSRHYLTKEYKTLNEMENEPCIYLPEQKRYARPNQIFFENVPFNKFTYLIPSKYEKFESLFQAMGVKDEPTVDNYISIILKDLVQHYVHDSEQKDTLSKGLASKEDTKIYISCVNYISEHFNAIEDIHLEAELFEQPSILNHFGRFKDIDDVLIDDSEWYKSFFNTNNDENDWLTGLTNIDWLFFERKGLAKLSKSVTIELDSTNGEERLVDNICKIIQDRRKLFIRVLDKRSKTIITKLLLYIDELSIVSFDQIKIIARVDNNRGFRYSTKPRTEEAYFNESEKKLILSRPIDKNNFVSILKPLLYTLLPDSDDTEVRSTLMAFDAICTREIEAAASYLDSLNYAKAEDIEIEEKPIEDQVEKG